MENYTKYTVCSIPDTPDRSLLFPIQEPRYGQNFISAP